RAVRRHPGAVPGQDLARAAGHTGRGRRRGAVPLQRPGRLRDRRNDRRRWRHLAMGERAGLRVLLRIQVEAGREGEFERLWCGHAAAVGELPGNLGQYLLDGVGEDRTYYVITDWVDEANFRAFERSDLQQDFLRRLRPMRADGSMSLLAPRYQFRKGGSRRFRFVRHLRSGLFWTAIAGGPVVPLPGMRDRARE